MTPRPAYALDRTPPAVPAAPRLDPSQRAVVAHPGGPLLVLAGPGTGKTTTLVEAVVDRVERGLRPDQVLVLTFSRKAADELRERIAGRLARTVAEPSAWTFHAWCLALVRAYTDGPAPRLLSGPERQVRIRELLRGNADGLGTRWPVGLRAALDTRGMAREVADLLDRARERGLEPGDLHRLGDAAVRPDWVAAAGFYAEYVAVLDASGEMDYGELVRAALQLLADPGVLAEVRQRYAAFFVDEYQDTDPAQEELLRLLAGGGGDLVVVGDPDQAIYGFRGADVGCLLGFPDRFRTAAGAPAPTLTLAVSRRAGRDLLAVSRRIAWRIPAPGLPVPRLRAHRDLQVPPEQPEVSGLAEDPPEPAARVRLFSTAGEEATAIADLLRRAHLRDGLGWDRMAVLVRSGVRSLPVLRRTLVAAGVPVAVAADEVPLARDPAVVPLLVALRCAADPDALTDDSVRLLLTSPLIRATPADLRRLGRALRELERRDADIGPGAALRLPRPAATLLREAVTSPGDLLLVDDRTAGPVRRLVDLLRAASEVLAAGGGAEEALWAIWERSGWSRRLAAAAGSGGAAGRAADRDLDAVVGLFEALARLEERRPRAGVEVLLAELEAQEIPTEGRAEGPIATGAVRLLTAHRAKGLEWDLVVVAGVQEGSWPDLRRRASLLSGDTLSRDGAVPAPAPAALLADERRLFYVAVTRARRRLVVTAVRSLDDDGDRPSRFLPELGLPVPEANERPAPLLSLPSLVGRLRRLTLDPGTPDGVRHVAVRQLARLAAPGPDGAALVPSADPAYWWGLDELTPGARPVRDPAAPVQLSGSAVSGYDTCPLAWFLQREARAATPASGAQGFGSVLHALARLVGTEGLPAEIGPLLDRLDEVWPALGFDAPWQSDRERRHAREALERFLRWHGEGDRTHLGSEVPFEVAYAGALLRGSMDRVERDPEGRVHVVDFKTGRTAVISAEVPEHPQLGVYQLAVRENALADLVGPDPVLGGAELVQLQQEKDGGAKVQPQPPLDPAQESDTWADRLVQRVGAGILAEQFPARVNDGCGRCAYRTACPAQDVGGRVVS